MLSPYSEAQLFGRFCNFLMKSPNFGTPYFTRYNTVLLWYIISIKHFNVTSLSVTFLIFRYRLNFSVSWKVKLLLLIIFFIIWNICHCLHITLPGLSSLFHMGCMNIEHVGRITSSRFEVLFGSVSICRKKFPVCLSS